MIGLIKSVVAALCQIFYMMEFMFFNQFILLSDAWTRYKSNFDWERTLKKVVAEPSMEIVPVGGGYGGKTWKPCAVITGGNSGIGYEAAYHLAKAGMLVIIACRSEKRGREAEASLRIRLGRAAAGNVQYVQCDISSFESVAKFATKIIDDKYNLKLLMCNAGIMCTEFDTTVDGFEMQMGVNHLGHALLIQKLLPYLKEKGPARIVCVGSKAMWKGNITEENFADYSKGSASVEDVRKAWDTNKFQNYRDSKTANVLHMLDVAEQLSTFNKSEIAKEKKSSVSICCYHPGCVATSIVSNSGMPAWLKWAGSQVDSVVMIPVDHSAAFAMRLCLDPQFDGGTLNGKYFDMSEEVRADSPHDDKWLHKVCTDDTMKAVVRSMTAQSLKKASKY